MTYPRICTTMPTAISQRDRALKLLKAQGMVRLSEFRRVSFDLNFSGTPACVVGC